MTCHTCLHWKRIGPPPGPMDSPMGHCRRHPPRVSDEGLRHVVAREGIGDEAAFAFDVIACATVFPITFNNSSCGEHDDGNVIC